LERDLSKNKAEFEKSKAEQAADIEAKQLELSALTDKLEKAKTDEGSATPGTGPEHVTHLEEQVRKLEA
jgi:hypothetical protein